MSDAVCLRCGRELTQVQRWNRKKYCSRDCFYDARFGERIEWNGVWIRPGQTLEVLKLYGKGLSESEARKAVGADFKAMRRIRNTSELAAFLPKRLCLFCGKSLEQKPLGSKYCSKSCKGKAKYDRKRKQEGQITRRVDREKRNRAIDLFARGLDGGSIARYLDIAV
jgi:predicted nucleic acid-binding Zn ribbon protein